MRTRKETEEARVKAGDPDWALKIASMAIKQQAAQKTKECPACGCNPSNALAHDKLLREKRILEESLGRQAAQTANANARIQFLESEKKWKPSWLESKMRRQSEALARLYLEVDYLRGVLREKEIDAETEAEA